MEHNSFPLLRNCKKNLEKIELESSAWKNNIFSDSEISSEIIESASTSERAWEIVRLNGKYDVKSKKTNAVPWEHPKRQPDVVAEDLRAAQTGV